MLDPEDFGLKQDDDTGALKLRTPDNAAKPLVIRNDGDLPLHWQFHNLREIPAISPCNSTQGNTSNTLEYASMKPAWLGISALAGLVGKSSFDNITFTAFGAKMGPSQYKVRGFRARARARAHFWAIDGAFAHLTDESHTPASLTSSSNRTTMT